MQLFLFNLAKVLHEDRMLPTPKLIPATNTELIIPSKNATDGRCTELAFTANLWMSILLLLAIAPGYKAKQWQ